MVVILVGSLCLAFWEVETDIVCIGLFLNIVAGFLRGCSFMTTHWVLPDTVYRNGGGIL